MHSASAYRRPNPTGALPASNSSYNPTTDNCTGLGWRKLLRDRRLVARQGQQVFLQPQQCLHSLYGGMRQGGYLFLRTGAVVVGGTDDEINNGSANPRKCAKFIAAHTAAFAGRMTFARSLMLPGYFVRK